MALWSILLEIFRKPTIGDILTELAMFTIPLWVAVIVGVLVGWAWKPKWANLGRDFLDSSVSKGFTVSLSASSFIPSSNSLKFQLPGCISWTADSGIPANSSSSQLEFDSDSSSSSRLEKEMDESKSNIVNEEDLLNLYKLVEEKDGGPAWIQMMDRCTSTMSYKAWRRDLESGPPQYRSRTVFEDATPEMVRDFFWDDEYRLKWDDMLIHASNLEECPNTGTMVGQWIRKFPFFCSDREYIIGRRIWDAGRVCYCITKGVPCSSVPRRNKPRRVDLYYSSWCIRAVESNRGDGQLTACEVLLFHYEDMGIPWEIAKLGVRQGMWGAVKKFDPALRIYQRERGAGAPLSRFAEMAHINTLVSPDYLRLLESNGNGSYCSSEAEKQDLPKKQGGNLPKLLVVGGAVALACTLDRGLLTKAVIFGVARRFANIGRRL